MFCHLYVCLSLVKTNMMSTIMPNTSNFLHRYIKDRVVYSAEECIYFLCFFDLIMNWTSYCYLYLSFGETFEPVLYSFTITIVFALNWLFSAVHFGSYYADSYQFSTFFKNPHQTKALNMTKKIFSPLFN